MGHTPLRDVLVFHDPDARLEEWRADDIDSYGDGGCDVVIFTGPHAEAGAKRFADRLLTQTD